MITTNQEPHEECEYLNLLRRCILRGHPKDDRTGTGTLSVFGANLRFNLKNGFPLITTKKIHLRSVIHELLWFLMGGTNTQYLNDNGVSIWNEWADSNGDMGPIYGKQWTDWIDYRFLPESELDEDTIDLWRKQGYEHYGEINECVSLFRRSTNQIQKVLDMLRDDPDSRRIYVSAINVGELDQMALEPCHNYFQFYTRKLSLVERFQLMVARKRTCYDDGYLLLLNPATGEIHDADKLKADLDEKGIPERELSCFFLMRSTDVFLGLPFNIASYALLTHMIAQQLNMEVGELVYQGVDVHLYNNHREQALTQLERDPFRFPHLFLHKTDSIFDYKYDDVVVRNYESHPAIKAPVAI